MIRIFEKKELYKAIEGFLKDYEVIGPKDLANKGIFYQRINVADELYLGERFAIEPIKKFFLSGSEWLLKEKFIDGKTVLEDYPLPDNKRIVIGLRPCEARGLTLLDKIFDPSTDSMNSLQASSGSTLSGVVRQAYHTSNHTEQGRSAERVDSEYKDKSYINNRNRSILIGLACASPDQSCFCASMGGLPVESRGMDILLFDIEDKFIAQILTDRGKELFGSLGEELKDDQIKSLELYKENRKNLIKNKIKVPNSLDGTFENTYWSEVSSACLSCGICTYLCPTCHCFDLVDEERKKLRCYDGCAFPDFTMEASGVNPRPSKKERYRQRAFHKFDYFNKNFGENLCVGCGRCIRYCPVKIDISDIIDKAPVAEK
jgi:ferredoxin